MLLCAEHLCWGGCCQSVVCLQGMYTCVMCASGAGLQSGTSEESFTDMNLRILKP